MTKFDDEAVQKIREAVNVIQVNEEEVGKEIANIHPTLQQGFMRIVVGFLREMAAKEYVDARNDRSRKLARLMLEDIPRDDLFLPLI